MGILRRKKKDEKEEKAAVSAKTSDTTKKAAPAKKTAEKKVEKKATATEFTRSLLLRPIITEKSATLASEGKYVFEIDPMAGRVEVKQAITEIYGIRPTAVNIQRYRRDSVRFKRRLGKQKSWKKAIVTMPKGKTIDVYEGV